MNNIPHKFAAPYGCRIREPFVSFQAALTENYNCCGKPAETVVVHLQLSDQQHRLLEGLPSKAETVFSPGMLAKNSTSDRTAIGDDLEPLKSRLGSSMIWHWKCNSYLLPVCPLPNRWAISSVLGRIYLCRTFLSGEQLSSWRAVSTFKRIPSFRLEFLS